MINALGGSKPRVPRVNAEGRRILPSRVVRKRKSTYNEIGRKVSKG
jgi:hypothetical protein